MIRVTDQFYVNQADVASIEGFEHYDHDLSGNGPCHRGTVVILKNGRKTYLRGFKPEDIYAKIFEKKESEGADENL